MNLTLNSFPRCLFRLKVSLQNGKTLFLSAFLYNFFNRLILNEEMPFAVKKEIQVRQCKE